MDEKPDKNETTSDKYCSQCHHPPTEVKLFWICPQHEQVSFEKLHTAFRIFLSYGHYADEELVVRINTDLEKRGHGVYLDEIAIAAIYFLHIHVRINFIIF